MDSQKPKIGESQENQLLFHQIFLFNARFKQKFEQFDSIRLLTQALYWDYAFLSSSILIQCIIRDKENKVIIHFLRRQHIEKTTRLFKAVLEIGGFSATLNDSRSNSRPSSTNLIGEDCGCRNCRSGFNLGYENRSFYDWYSPDWYVGRNGLHSCSQYCQSELWD
ncbi:MAG: hypothetical protein BWY41_01625 [Candidatus Atribacteria bacterium ADurb.Bin276]|uniref:Uncharacterized protein n=1 Tax=Candidatus Atribacter allofermentans TaxID=1852833 RepID=A0A1V5SLX3_9BACT|nr:MAG: hypothetical protein BWY41_01625 [Candidatus Atribacteria bacterium ADurb.Bin276]